MRFSHILKSLVVVHALEMAALTSAGGDCTRYVNPWIGTEGNGHATVAAAYPLGMVQAGPDTGTESWDYASGYRNGDTKLYGFSQNHLNGTGVPELGDLLILPFADSAFPIPRSPVSFDKSSEVATPGYYAVTHGSGELVFEMSDKPFDVVVVGGTSAGIAAGVQATRDGARTVVLEPTQRIGGMTTGGLGQTDIGDKSAFGGLARKFYSDIRKHYDDPASWTRQKRRDYRPNGQTAGSSDGETMWTFEPSAALKVLENWEREEGLRIERGAVLDRGEGGVVKENGRIVSVRTLDGRVWRGSVFIDATYEGDLMAAAGVSYRVGREANSEYGETINGIQRGKAVHHQIQNGVSAYRVPGDPSSGLLPGVEPEDDGRPDGSADNRVQAYCYRLCLTDDPANRIPFEKPEGYDEAEMELLLRNIERTPEDTTQHWRHQPWNNSPMPNRKTDTNNRTGVSSDFIGGSWRWAEADYAERGRIAAAHEKWQRSVLWTLANHPRVPQYVRADVSKWGLCKDEFVENGGWPTQLYVREARRMVGEYVMTEANCRGKRVAGRPVAYAAYTMDSHHVRRYVDKNGMVRNEGDVQERTGMKVPYPIDYGAIVPKRGECSNLLVPVCISATHIAYGSIRMEPVFFALGQAAGAAAAVSSRDGLDVQDVEVTADPLDSNSSVAFSDYRLVTND